MVQTIKTRFIKAKLKKHKQTILTNIEKLYIITEYNIKTFNYSAIKRLKNRILDIDIFTFCTLLYRDALSY